MVIRVFILLFMNQLVREEYINMKTGEKVANCYIDHLATLILASNFSLHTLFKPLFLTVQ